jgi:proline iminopeptidase
MKNKHTQKHSRASSSSSSKKTLRQTRKNKLYPSIKPLQEYYLKVSPIHTIYFATYGHPHGKPVLYIHGGPGAGTTPMMARFFHPDKYLVVLVDQRGCGKSTPSAELQENTTNNLIRDFEKIRKILHIDQWMVYGGSWGSTLSLAYAIHHPDRTSELILRGIFFCTQDEVDWISEPKGAQFINPEGWKQYAEAVQHRKFKGKFIHEYQKCFQGKYGPRRKDQCLLAWASWESSMSTLNMKKIADVIRETKKEKYNQVSAIELHYMTNQCFLPPSYFLKKKNLQKLQHIPIIIVQGMYDLVCPYITAYKLHQALPHSQFWPTMAGHSATDEENVHHLVKATNSFV